MSTTVAAPPSPGTLTLTGGEALARSLRPEGVAFAFGIAGGKIAPFLKGLSDDSAIRYVGVRHESAAAFMAAGIYAGTGRMAVAVSELGPGTANVVGGIVSAYNQRLPLLLITSNTQHATNYPAAGQMMELDTLAFLRPITKWNAVVHDGRRIPQLVQWAFREALTGQPGPVHLDIPQDILSRTYTFDESAFSWEPAQHRISGLVPGDAAIREAAELLKKAERPLLIAGGGATRGDAATPFRRIAEQLDAAATTTQNGVGVLETAGPRFIGHGGVMGGAAVLRALREADVVLTAGVRFSSWLWDDRGPIVGRNGQKIIQIDIDPALMGKLVPVSAGLVGDAELTLNALATALSDAKPPQRAWVRDLRATYVEYRSKLEALAAERTPVMHPAALAQAVGRALPANALVTFDGGHTSFWSNDFTPAAAPRTRFNEQGNGHLGFGVPYAIALKLANSDVPVVNLVGDGSFGFTLNELDTARRYGTPFLTIVHNNASWGSIGGVQKSLGYHLGVELADTDYAAIARAFGGFGEVVERLEDVAPAIARALASNLPAVLDCRTRFVPHPNLPAFGKGANVGMTP